MNLLKRLSGFLTRLAPREVPNLYPLQVRCSRCGEVIQTHINLGNDLSLEYREDGTSVYYCRKVLVGQARCFQNVEVHLMFDAGRRLLEREITGGEFVEG